MHLYQEYYILRYCRCVWRAGVDLRILLLQRSARDVLASTTRRKFGTSEGESAVLEKCARLLHEQLAAIDARFVMCSHFIALPRAANATHESLRAFIHPSLSRSAWARAVPRLVPQCHTWCTATHAHRAHLAARCTAEPVHPHHVRGAHRLVHDPNTEKKKRCREHTSEPVGADDVARLSVASNSLYRGAACSADLETASADSVATPPKDSEECKAKGVSVESKREAKDHAPAHVRGAAKDSKGASQKN